VGRIEKRPAADAADFMIPGNWRAPHREGPRRPIGSYILHTSWAWICRGWPLFRLPLAAKRLRICILFSRRRCGSGGTAGGLRSSALLRPRLSRPTYSDRPRFFFGRPSSDEDFLAFAGFLVFLRGLFFARLSFSYCLCMTDRLLDFLDISNFFLPYCSHRCGIILFSAANSFIYPSCFFRLALNVPLAQQNTINIKTWSVRAAWSPRTKDEKRKFRS